MSSSNNKLNRFTTLPFLLEILQTKELTLLNPESWEDKNDVDILKHYKKANNVKNLFALCFTHENETIHHWNSFAKGENGCCIEFFKDKLLKIIDKENIHHSEVKYLSVNDSIQVLTKDIPFTKRLPYQCENEYRFIFEEKDGESVTKKVKIGMSTIKKITLSPSLPISTYTEIEKIIKKLIGKNKIEINPSTLFKNEKWIYGFKHHATSI